VYAFIACSGKVYLIKLTQKVIRCG